MVTRTGIEKPAAEATAACGGNREPEQAQRSQKASPAQGAQPDAVTASRSPASASRGAKTVLRTVFRAREIPIVKDNPVPGVLMLSFQEENNKTYRYNINPALLEVPYTYLPNAENSG